VDDAALDSLDSLDSLAQRLAERSARGLAHAVSAAVGAGELAPGHRLPPVRTVAGRLGLSPSTVGAAWALLSRAGAISTDGRRGTVVSAGRPAAPTRYRRALDRSAGFTLDLSTGVPDPALLPDLGPALLRLPAATSPGSYLDDPTLPELAEVLRSELPCPVDQLTVTDGAMDAVQLALTELVGFGERVVVESPCFAPLLDLLESRGARVVGVPVDEEGLRPDALAHALSAPAAAVILQPRAQNPAGGSLSRGRAEELAATVARGDAMVIEDDSAGSIATTPPISLGSWIPGRVLHIRSFSKSHGPDLRLAVLGGPAALMARLIDRRHLGQGWTSRLLQRLLLDLLTDGNSVAQVRLAQQEYARRRAQVVTSLRRHGIDLPTGDGLNLWLPVRDETGALVTMASHGIAVAAGSPFQVIPEAAAHVRVTVGLVADDVDRIAALLAGSAQTVIGRAVR
jgi:DNA-binding transcriptional MocR family regulator